MFELRDEGEEGSGPSCRSQMSGLRPSPISVAVASTRRPRTPTAASAAAAGAKLFELGLQGLKLFKDAAPGRSPRTSPRGSAASQTRARSSLSPASSWRTGRSPRPDPSSCREATARPSPSPCRPGAGRAPALGGNGVFVRVWRSAGSLAHLSEADVLLRGAARAHVRLQHHRGQPRKVLALEDGAAVHGRKLEQVPVIAEDRGVEAARRRPRAPLLALCERYQHAQFHRPHTRAR